jgi:hypothetical protein
MRSRLFILESGESVSEAGPALCSTPSDDGPAGSGTHPYPETVSLLLVARVGLIGALHRYLLGIPFGKLLPGDDRTTSPVFDKLRGIIAGTVFSRR